MTKPPESIHSVWPVHAFEARGGPASLSLFDPQSNDDALRACCKASWLKVTITFDPSIAPKKTHWLSRMGFEWAKDECERQTKLWESIEPTEANLEELLTLPWAADKSQIQEQLDMWRTKAQGTFSMWKHTKTGRLRLVCMDDQTPTMIDSGNTPCPYWVLWLIDEPYSGGFLWDRDHQVQFDYLPEGEHEGISTGTFAPTIGPRSELGPWNPL